MRKAAIVTGGGSGIGRAVSVELARKGYAVAVLDLKQETAEETAARIRADGGEAKAFCCDIGKVSQVKAVVSVVAETYGCIDVLVNNAGICFNNPIGELTEEIWDTTMNINLKGAFFCTKFVFEKMVERGLGGRIISMASIAGERGGLHAGVDYSVSKGGLITMTKCIALSGAQYGITANAVAPGTVDTEITRRLGHSTADIPLGRKAEPEEIAYAVSYLASDEASYITGMVIDVNGGLLMR